MLGHNDPLRSPPVTAHTSTPARKNSRTSRCQRTEKRPGPGYTQSHPPREPRTRYAGFINQMRPWEYQEYRPPTPPWPGPPRSHPSSPCAQPLRHRLRRSWRSTPTPLLRNEVHRTSPAQSPSTSPNPRPSTTTARRSTASTPLPPPAWIDHWLETPTNSQVAHAILPRHRPNHPKQGNPDATQPDTPCCGPHRARRTGDHHRGGFRPQRSRDVSHRVVLLVTDRRGNRPTAARSPIGCGCWARQNGTRPIYDTYFEVKKFRVSGRKSDVLDCQRCWADIHPTDGTHFGSFPVSAIGCEVGTKTRVILKTKPDGAFVFTQSIQGKDLIRLSHRTDGAERRRPPSRCPAVPRSRFPFPIGVAPGTHHGNRPIGRLAPIATLRRASGPWP